MIGPEGPWDQEPGRAAPHPPAPDDLATCLAKATARSDRPAMVLTLGAAPTRNLLAHVFGPAATANLIVRPASAGAGVFLATDGTAAQWPSPDAHAVVARFLDAATFERMCARHRRRLADAAAVILAFPPSARQCETLAGAGFADLRRFPAPGRETTVFLRPQAPFPPRRAAPTLRDRPGLRRLVIVDPCLGGAAGHYDGYARMLTRGAQALGVEVVWGCHAGLDAARMPGVSVRPCFTRSFHDLPGEAVGTVDLSAELLGGWAALVAEFDAVDTHFLMHSADAHQLRAVAALLRAGPAPASVIHVNFQTSPRFMPGRVAGIEAHRAVAALRSATAWERSLFFWAETRRLGVWLSQWLGGGIPALPFLTPWGHGGASPGRDAGATPTLSFLGEGRPTKGFLDLPDLVDAIAGDPRLPAAPKVVIQNWRPSRGDPARHDQAIARLKAHNFVEVVDGVLDPQAYDARLAQADILLLPYDPATYDLQGSGILVEGFSHGSIILARAGMAVEDEAEHGLILTWRTPHDLAGRLADILTDFENLSRLARRKAEHFRTHATPDRYITALDIRARGERA